MSRRIHPVMVGTAGHIDHGKSSLVRALTGIDPDRLKEEKKRGLTIDLGFARFKMANGRLLGLIDVPGHERFVRNMVAGSTGLDLAMLVVAADDGVMPQTREHLDILDVLGVQGGLVALTKVDLVDEETQMLAEDEVRELLRGTVLDGVEVYPLSSTTGDGVEELRAALELLAADVSVRPSTGTFRMPIQRVFSLPGIGTVISGIPLDGAVRAGQELEVLPHGKKLKVRAVHAYGGTVEEAVAGHSTALSVPDAKDAGIGRGMVAAAPGIYPTGDAVDVELRLLPHVSQSLCHRSEVRFHTGTSEVRGHLLLLDRDEVTAAELELARLAAAGDSVDQDSPAGAAAPDAVLARVLLHESVCCAHGDRFLLRLVNPVVTVGGGRVLRVGTAPRRYRRQELGEELTGLLEAGSRPETRVLHEIEAAGPAGRKAKEVAAALGLDEASVVTVLEDRPELHLHARSGRAFTVEVMQAGATDVLRSVEKILASKPLAASIQRTALQVTRSLPAELRDAVLDLLEEGGKVRAGTQGEILFLDRLKPLPAEDQSRLDKLTKLCADGGCRPPTAAELAERSSFDAKTVEGMLARARDEQRVRLVGDHWYAASTLDAAMRAIVENCRRHDGALEIPELRDALDTSRKFLIPLLEWIDAQGLTLLRGGVRTLLTSSEGYRAHVARLGLDDPNLSSSKA